ncbi:MAG: acyl-CoA/acyl-ACP dehydrogenase [Fuerstiella sp.]|nr:acyl-CoA/acyl-ACP dehydrogenase [Fuerstiella sp.]
MMSPEEREQLTRDVEAFCEEVRPIEDICYLEHRFNDQVLPLAKKYNIAGMHVPKEYGGRGVDVLAYMMSLVRIGREGTGLRTFFSGHCSIGQTPIIEWGNEEQKEKYLSASACGDKILAFGLTEPDAGSNPQEMQMTYRREGDKFVLNGVKYLISNGTIAHAIVTFAYPEGKMDRISAFIVDTDGPGIEQEALTAKLGLPTSDTSMYELSEYAVPVENLLGEEGDGWRIAMATLCSGRLSVASGSLGVIEDCLEEAVNYARGRSQHGKPIAKHQLVQDHIARIEIARQASESLLVTAVNAKMDADAAPDDRDLYHRADILAAEAKFFISNAGCDAADRAIQVLGGRGYSELYRPGRHWKDVRVCRIYEGTDEILKLKIAASILGKGYEAFR